VAWNAIIVRISFEAATGLGVFRPDAVDVAFQK
jgi:hypothetical protein